MRPELAHPDRSHHELRFEVMGSAAHLAVVDGDPELLDSARSLLEDLHRRWSRFDPDSEISRLNAAEGAMCLVSEQTFQLVSTAIDAHRLTEGRFDPTVHDAVRAAGYRRSWSDRDISCASIDAPVLTAPTATPGCDDIALSPSVWGITLPAGVRLDVGAIAKGHAADLAVRHLRERGASGALASLGGDVAVDGAAPQAGGWIVEIADAHDHRGNPLRVRLERGAVCTSSTRRRRWLTADHRPAHHVIDPRTGLPSDTGIDVSVVVARRAAGAEVAATAAMLAGRSAISFLDRLGVPGLVIAVDDQRRMTDSMTRLVAASSASPVGAPS